jgi:hypothetical protein
VARGSYVPLQDNRQKELVHWTFSILLLQGSFGIPTLVCNCPFMEAFFLDLDFGKLHYPALKASFCLNSCPKVRVIQT